MDCDGGGIIFVSGAKCEEAMEASRYRYNWFGARGGSRTHTPFGGLGGLSPLLLPFPPPGPHSTVSGGAQCGFAIVKARGIFVDDQGGAIY